MRAGSVHSQIRVCMVADLIRLDQTEPLQADFCSAGGVNSVILGNCTSCHNPITPLSPAIPVVYADACDDTIDAQTADARYRNLLTRIDPSSPLDSLLLRKPTSGAARIDAIDASDISGYHGGGTVFSNDESGQRNISTIINWVNHGAQFR